MLYRYCAMLLLGMLFACGQGFARGIADDSGTDPAVVIDRHIQHYVVDPSGAYLLTVDSAKTIVEARAVQEHGQYYISYNKTLDDVVALDAYTLKPDGRRVPLRPGQVKDQQEAASTDAPMFQDTRLKIVVFPEVAVGDQLVVNYAIRRTTPLFPGHFEDLSFSPFYLNKNFVLIYDMPASMPLHADAVGFVPLPLSPRDVVPKGRKRYQWRYVGGDNQRLEADSVSYLDYGRRLAVSTFEDYADFARAFRANSLAGADTGARADAAAATAAASAPAPAPAPAPATTPAIATLARQLSAGLPDARARALALSDWVRRNIRYVGVYIGPGGVVAHPAATVLDNRYGDCKDHAALLEAMLAAVGIESTGALVNSGNAYQLPETPTLGVFNHMITYVPSLDLYLDPTAEATMAGYLPAGILGKPALLLASGRFAMTPVLQPARSRTATWFDIGRDGRSRFKVSKTASGAGAEPWRQTVRDTRQADREQFVRRMLLGLGQKGQGVFDAGTVNDPGKDGNDEYRLSFSGSSDHFLALPGPSALATTYDFWGGLGEAVFTLGQEKERRQAFVCPAIDAEDETGFRLPKGVRVLALPKATNLMDGGIHYQSTYQLSAQARQGSAIVVKRRLTFRHGRATCTPDDYRAMQPALERIMRDLRSQVVVSGR
jgi:transglutaminase-like putative cysteine protease